MRAPRSALSSLHSFYLIFLPRASGGASRSAHAAAASCTAASRAYHLRSHRLICFFYHAHIFTHLLCLLRSSSFCCTFCGRAPHSFARASRRQGGRFLARAHTRPQAALARAYLLYQRCLCASCANASFYLSWHIFRYRAYLSLGMIMHLYLKRCLFRSA